MSAVDRTFIEERLRNIAQYRERIGRILTHEDKEINENFLLFHSLERLIQLVVDEMLDINTHIIQYAPLRAPEDFQSTFIVLAQHDMLPKDFAERLAPIVGLRNRLVHRYERVHIDLLISMARREQPDLQEYGNHLEMYIERIETDTPSL
jgi:uncharacterized protein YutE (UPF0331/DUF86 family)